MYPLPHDLVTSIRALFKGLGLDAKTRKVLNERIVNFLVRENRKLRKKVLEFGRTMSDYASTEEADYGEAVGSYAAEEAALFISAEILRKAIYVNTKEERERKAAVEKFIDELSKDQTD